MVFYVFLLTLLFPAAYAQDLPSCESPAQAADTLLALLQPEDFRPKEAAACLNLSPAAESKGPKLAAQLKEVLDARGYYIKVAELPGPDDVIPEEVKSFPLVDAEPVIYLEKVGDRWLWSSDTVRAIPELHAATFTGFGSTVRKALPPSFQTPLVGPLKPWQFVVFGLLLAAALLGALLVNLVLRNWLLRLVKGWGLAIDEQTFERTRGPVRALVFCTIFLVGISEMALPVQVSVVLLFMTRVALAGTAVVIGLRWIDVFSGVFKQRAAQTDTRMDDQVVPLVARLLKFIVSATALVFVLSNLGIDVGGLIAGLGIGGIAIAFGAQDTVANLFGSITIFADRPFQVGDWVKIGGVEGAVEEVGFRSTRIRAVSSSVVTVPNRTVAGAEIDNLGQRTARRTSTTLGLTYGTDRARLQAFIEGVRQIINAHPFTLAGPIVELKDFGASSLDVMVIFNMKADDYAGECAIRGEIYMQFIALGEALEVDFAFPSQSLYMESTPERPLQAKQVVSAEELQARIDAVAPLPVLGPHDEGVVEPTD